MDKVKVLHFELSCAIGGIESFLLNLYKNVDNAKIQFDFVTVADKPAFESQLKELGGNIYRVANYINIIEYYKSVKAIICANDYDVIHIHKNSAANIIPMLIAIKTKRKVIIVHSHNTAPSKKGISNILHLLNRTYLRNHATYTFACSEIAANWLYGKKFTDTHNIKIIKNGIVSIDYKYNEQIRKEVIEELQIQDKFVIGHVGRFTEQKNHNFLIEIFKEIRKIHSNSVLMLIGTGALEDKIKRKISLYGLDNSVLFLHERNDICRLMQAMDVFVLPSLYEGLPVVGIEAQAAGLPMVISANIANELDLTPNITRVSLNSDSAEWAKIIVEKTMQFKRIDTSKMIIDSGFDMKNSAAFLSSIYLKNSKFNLTR